MSKSPSPRKRSGDLGFRAGTGFFAALVVLLVAGIALVLWQESRLSIAKFGFSFWKTKTWDPVSGDFGALPFIWGTLYSSFLALLISTPVALGIAIFLSELSPRFLRTPLAFLTELLAAIPSIVYGLWGVFVLVPLVRKLEILLPDGLKKIATLFRPAPRRRDALGGAHPRGHGHPVHLLGRARGPQGRARDAARGRVRARRDALGGDPGRDALRAHRHPRGDHPRSRPRDRRDDGRHDGDREQPDRHVRRSFAPQYTMAAVIANEFTEAASNLYSSALIEIGLVLFAITLVINAASRLLIWSVNREIKAPAPRTSPSAAAREATSA